jgi:hypothetical protein
MPVKKFRTFEEAERDLWCFEPDERYFKRVSKMFKKAKELYNPSYPKGVHKYRTIEEAQEDMDKWRREYIQKRKRAAKNDSI